MDGGFIGAPVFVAVPPLPVCVLTHRTASTRTRARADADRELRSLHRDYARFVLLKSETQSLATGARGTVRLPNGDLAIQFLGFSADKVQRIRHRVEMPGLNATVRAVAPGGRTIDVLQVGDKLVIVATTVGR